VQFILELDKLDKVEYPRLAMNLRFIGGEILEEEEEVEEDSL